MQLLVLIAIVALLGTPVTYIATHGGVFRKNKTTISRREKLALFLQLYGAVYFLCLVYALLIVGGFVDDDISFSNRRLPIHFLWAFFAIPILSIIIGKVWFRYRYSDSRTKSDT